MRTIPVKSRILLIVPSFAAILLFVILPASLTASGETPLPEHPRPDFERSEWLNLNGPWQFRFDESNAGLNEKWFMGGTPFPDKILVPFPWGSPLSGVPDKAALAWYSRTVRMPEAWAGRRIFLVVGACDWETQAWLNGQPLGTHRGGYTPFEFELTTFTRPGQDQRLCLRVDDQPRKFKLEGKQGYGNARGIWQTVYLEARPQTYAEYLHFVPDVDRERVKVKTALNQAAPQQAQLRFHFKNAALDDVVQPLTAGKREFEVEVPIPHPRLWSLQDPFLYEIDATLTANGVPDRVSSYFGMRKISVVNLPGTDFPYVALNGKPVYLEMTLDQSYNPEGFYTFPSDAFMRDEILRSRRLGLNANRLHVKIDVPRKLYWADRLGLLLMADVPNSWGEPDADMRGEIETALRGMILRDFNHPSIFAWVTFNETWGLATRREGKNVYLPETQEWVAGIYRLAKQLDPSRLVEDNSADKHDHVETDINSWHAYLPGFGWRALLDQITRDSFPGSKWNFIGGRTQGRQPLLNSECGNVWGYEGSTGDVDWSWDYHIMINEFRRHPKLCGWLYTEHHDVVNEWNGYYRYDRSEKFTGLEELVPGMSLRDLHSPFYIVPEGELCRLVKPGEKVRVPLWASLLADEAPGDQLILHTDLYGWDTLGRREDFARGARTIDFQPWTSKEIAPLEVTMPDKRALAVLSLVLSDRGGTVLHHNFTTFLIGDGASPRSETLPADGANLRAVRFAPNTFMAAEWSLKQWNIMDGLKVNGAGWGYFEYRIPWPADLDAGSVAGVKLIFEASAKQLFGKDRSGAAKQEGDFMLGKGTHDPSLNPNSYPMTDTVTFPSAVRVRVAGQAVGAFELPDDPADHRGILSWYSQLRDKKLREAGSYGYLITASVPAAAWQAAAQTHQIVVRLEVDSALPGGLAIYGERFGRYPVDPTLLFLLK
ncbi:MAG TPA: glycoside hydrolase family 2 TIM barrel-domain containing protein [Acidobacteriota bacterium]|nr:glycoside hydrolase family 2 TIM barrel-domain containing protein [Acidobacteriota bacterium]